VLEDRRLLSYSVIDLGTLPGGGESWAQGMNDSGQVVGGALTASGYYHAFLYSNGTMIDLGTLPGGLVSVARGINNSGQVVGESETGSGSTHAFLYSNGTMTDLGTLGGTNSSAYAVNDSGEVVGQAGGRAFLYSGGTMTDLGFLPVLFPIRATGINNSGQIVGEAATPSGTRAFLFADGTFTDLGTLPGDTKSSAYAINDSGQVVGYAGSQDDGHRHAFLYGNGTMTDLGTLGGIESFAYAVNDSGQVVGHSQTAGGYSQPFLYSNGTMTNLGTVPGLNGAYPWAINDSGQVAGMTIYNRHAFLLTGSQASTTTVVSVSPNPLQFGHSVTFMATVIPESGDFDDGGTVQFAVDGTNFGAPLALSGGIAGIQYPAALTIGTHTITASYSGDIGFSASSGTAYATIVGPVDLTLSTLTVLPSQIASRETATVALVARDANGNQEPIGGLTVAFGLGNGAGSGTFSSVTDHGDGTYAATLTGTAAGSNTITATINGQPVVSEAPTLTVTPGAPSLAKSTVSVAPARVPVGGSSTVTLTVRDAYGNQQTGGGLALTFGLGSGSGGGSFSAVTDNHDGTYTATFTATALGSNTITATIGGQPLTSEAPVVTIFQPASLSRSTVTVSRSRIVSGSTSIVTLTARDASGNRELSGALTVAFGLGIGPGRGTFSAVTYSGNGTYTATFTATTAGSNTFTATIGGQAVTSKRPAVTVVPGPVSLSQSTVTLSQSQVTVGGRVTVTLTLRDANGNRRLGGGLGVKFALADGSAGGTFGWVMYRLNGIYRATLTAKAVGTDTIIAMIGGQLLTSTPPTLTVTPKTASASPSLRALSALLAAGPDTWSGPLSCSVDGARPLGLHDAALLTLGWDHPTRKR